MPNLTVTLTAQEIADLIEVFGRGYQSTLLDGSPNPQTKAQYAKASFKTYVDSQINNYRLQQATYTGSNVTVS